MTQPSIDNFFEKDPLVLRSCSTCENALADYWVKQDNGVPRPICARCLDLLQESMENEQRLREEAKARAQRRSRRRSEKNARKKTRGR
jgi:hypothetical protein